MGGNLHEPTLTSASVTHLRLGSQAEIGRSALLPRLSLAPLFSYWSAPNFLINNPVQECMRWEMTVYLRGATEVCQNHQEDARCCLPWQHKWQTVFQPSARKSLLLLSLMYIINLTHNSVGAEVKSMAHDTSLNPWRNQCWTHADLSSGHFQCYHVFWRAQHREGFGLQNKFPTLGTEVKLIMLKWPSQICKQAWGPIPQPVTIPLVWATVAIPRVGSRKGQHKWLSLFWGQLLPPFLRPSNKTAEADQPFSLGPQGAGLTIWCHLCSALRSLESSRT